MRKTGMLVPLEGQIHFVEGFRRGWEIAHNQGKPILILFTADWCNYCHAMAREAFCESSVVNLSQEFTCVLVDADAEPEVCRQFRVRGYPTIQFLSPRGLPLNRLTGKQAPVQLANEMQAALQAVAQKGRRTHHAPTSVNVSPWPTKAGPIWPTGGQPWLRSDQFRFNSLTRFCSIVFACPIRRCNGTIASQRQQSLDASAQ